MIKKTNTVIPAFDYFAENEDLSTAGRESCYLIGHNLRNPMNHGALIRLGSNIGAKKVFFTANPERFSFTKIKKSAGSSHVHMNFEFSTWDKITKEIPAEYHWIAVETSAKAEMLYKADLPEKCVFVVGNETYGLPEEALNQCSKHVYIPMPGYTKSMNVSHAATVVVFEWLRRYLAP